jgi:hypothetical protein
MKTAKELELDLIVKEALIQQLKYKNEMLLEELGSLYEDKIDKIYQYIKENYCNADGSIWHEAMQDIYNILEGEEDDKN